MSESNGEKGRPIIAGSRPMGADAGDRAMLESRLAASEGILPSGDWRLLTSQAEEEFSREGLRQITEMARIM